MGIFDWYIVVDDNLPLEELLQKDWKNTISKLTYSGTLVFVEIAAILWQIYRRHSSSRWEYFKVLVSLVHIIIVGLIVFGRVASSLSLFVLAMILPSAKNSPVAVVFLIEAWAFGMDSVPLLWTGVLVAGIHWIVKCW